jgi:hypothetical protein
LTTVLDLGFDFDLLPLHMRLLDGKPVFSTCGSIDMPRVIHSCVPFRREWIGLRDFPNAMWQGLLSFWSGLRILRPFAPYACDSIPVPNFCTIYGVSTVILRDTVVIRLNKLGHLHLMK